MLARIVHALFKTAADFCKHAGVGLLTLHAASQTEACVLSLEQVHKDGLSDTSPYTHVSALRLASKLL